MNLNKKDVVVGFLIIAILVASYLIYKNVKNQKKLSSPSQTQISVEYKKDFEGNFKVNLPEDENLFELKDVEGGDSRGLATKSEILVDAKDPDKGYFYQAWLEKDGSLKPLGKLMSTKGGWILSFESGEIISDSKIVVSLESKNDNMIEKKILEGSF